MGAFNNNDIEYNASGMPNGLMIQMPDTSAQQSFVLGTPPMLPPQGYFSSHSQPHPHQHLHHQQHHQRANHNRQASYHAQPPPYVRVVQHPAIPNHPHPPAQRRQASTS